MCGAAPGTCESSVSRRFDKRGVSARRASEVAARAVRERRGAKRAALIACLLLAACGSMRDLRPAPGESLPVAPYGAETTPTPKALLTPTAQQRPDRSDELLTRSEERRSDEFDLPPR